MLRVSGRLNKRKIKNNTLDSPSSKVSKVEYTFTALPIDCIRSICSFLEVNDLLSFSLTCTTFRTCIISTVDHAYNPETISSFYFRGFHGVLQKPQNVVSNMKLIELMKVKFEQELQNLRYDHFYQLVMNNPKLSHCIHEISNWTFEKIDGKQIYVSIEFDWTRNQKNSHFHFVHYGETYDFTNYGCILCVHCEDDGLIDPFFIMRCCPEDEPNLTEHAEVLYSTTKQAASHVISHLELKMDPIEFVNTLFHLCLMEPYELGSSESIEKEIFNTLWILVRKFNFHPDYQPGVLAEDLSEDSDDDSEDQNSPPSSQGSWNY